MLTRLITTAALLLAVPAAAAEPQPASAKEKEAAAPWGRLLAADGKTAYDLTKATVIVGSAAPADVILADATVAAQHLRLTFKDGVVLAEDMGGKFGTLLNGTALKKGKPVRIATRSSLALAAVTVTFEFGSRPVLMPPTQAAPKGSKDKSKASPQGKAKVDGKAARPGPIK